jgi:hypothetical protein
LTCRIIDKDEVGSIALTIAGAVVVGTIGLVAPYF